MESIFILEKYQKMLLVRNDTGDIFERNPQQNTWVPSEISSTELCWLLYLGKAVEL